MLNFAPGLRIYLHTKPIDMRKSYDALFGIVSADFGRDVRSGGLFLFINQSRNRIKLLYWDNDGLAIWMKRLESGTFQRPTSTGEAQHVILDVTQLQLLLSGIELSTVKRRKRYTSPIKIEETAE
jgi:transposase